MANEQIKNKPLAPPVGPVVAQALAQVATGGETNAQLQEELLAYLRHMNKQAQIVDEANEKEAEINRKFHLSRIESAKEEKQIKLDAQNRCGHVMPNGRSKVRGQRDGSRRTILHCLECAKVWHQSPSGHRIFFDEQGVPIKDHLIPNEDQIGGLV